MKISDILHKNWLVLNCAQCKTHHYCYDKINKQNGCTCGNEDMEILEIDEWNAADYVFICHEELKRNGYEKFIDSFDNLHDNLKRVISSEQLYDKVIKVLLDGIFDLIEP